MPPTTTCSTPDAAGREPAAPDAADGSSVPWIELACGTAALLGTATFASECIITDSVDMSPVSWEHFPPERDLNTPLGAPLDP
jgi:hypothetical protein